MSAPANAAVLTKYLPAVGTRVVLESGSEIPDNADCLLLALLDGEDGLELVAPSVIGSAAPEILEVLEAMGAKAKLESVTRIPAPAGFGVKTIAAVGLGDDAPNSESIRRAAGAAARALKSTDVVVNALGEIDAVAAAEGFALGAYSYSGLKSASDNGTSTAADSTDTSDAEQTEKRVIILGASDAEVERASLVADAVNTARDFVNTPSSHLYPESFAAAAQALGEDAGLKVEVLDDAALRDGGYGGLNAVGGGSSRGPRLVRLMWEGKGDSVAKLGLVGKGVTFDTGGISLKPGASMENMISDMGGAAAVIASVVLAARLGVAVPVTATVPMAENMPGGKSYRPGDVITQYGGKTVEIRNTDAEGRLILADAIVRACEDKPTHLIDTATLTGAQLVALGERTPGVMGTEEFRDLVAELSQEIGENAWAMPIPEEIEKALESWTADLQNIHGSRFGGMSAAAAFLKAFVAEDVEWAHIDVAGPAFNTSGEFGYTPKKGTGVPVRTILAVMEQLSESA